MPYFVRERPNIDRCTQNAMGRESVTLYFVQMWAKTKPRDFVFWNSYSNLYKQLHSISTWPSSDLPCISSMLVDVNERWLFYTPVFRRDVLWYGAVRPSVRPSVRSSVRPTVSTKKHRCKWRIFFKFCTQVCLGVPSINLLFVLSYLIKYAHNSIISDFSIFGIHRVIF